MKRFFTKLVVSLAISGATLWATLNPITATITNGLNLLWENRNLAASAVFLVPASHFTISPQDAITDPRLSESDNILPDPENPTTTPKQGRKWVQRAGLDSNQVVPKLIQCESGGVSQCIMDVNGKSSCGVLMYQSSTWDAFSAESGITGSPRSPQDAITMTHWAVENGKLTHWLNCSIKYGWVQTST